MIHALAPSLRMWRECQLLLQGETTVSYDRWLDLAARFRARGLDRARPDDEELARLVTLADLERELKPAP
jgi:hypothetical protein